MTRPFRDGGKRARESSMGFKITARKKAELEQVAAEMGVTRSEVVHRALDLLLEIKRARKAEGEA